MTINTILTSLKNLTLTELTALITSIESEFNISNITYSNQISTDTTNINSSEKTTEPKLVDIVLIKFPSDKKIAVLKLIRTITGFGLKESKELVDNIPSTIKKQILETDALKIVQEFNILNSETILK